MMTEAHDDLARAAGLRSPIIQEEHPWLTRPRSCAQGQQQDTVLASRWSGSTSEPLDVSSDIDAAYHVIAIALKTMNLSIRSDGKLVHEGRVMPAMARINQPSEPLRATFHDAYDILHLYIPNGLFAECVDAGCTRRETGRARFSEAPLPPDPVIDHLARAFMQAEHLDGALGYYYAESVALAIVARILGRSSGTPSYVKRSRTSGLPKWRLKRAVDYVDANLGEPIGLADMAASAGLSRMHFAAQFRTATGFRPHEYLLRKRTERAQALLSTSTLPLVEIALEVGFKSQSHFTTVFTRFVGKPPSIWRHQTLSLPARDRTPIPWQTQGAPRGHGTGAVESVPLCRQANSPLQLTQIAT
jgi:AraC family transcriptional regulator